MIKRIIQEDLIKVNEILNDFINTSYSKIERMGGMTNHTYHVWTESGDELVVRLPGEGTEELICRKDEKISTELACSLGIDAELLFFNDEGAKICKYIEDAVTLSAEQMKDENNIKKAAEIFSLLHNSGVDTEVPFEVFDMASAYENIINKNEVSLYDDYYEVKNAVEAIKGTVGNFVDNKKGPCHNDSLIGNWVLGRNKLYLIDWEYAGMNDVMWDLADLSIEAAYEEVDDELLLKYYFGRQPSLEEKKRFIANKIYVDYLWTLWGLTRVPFDGQELQDYADERYERLKVNIEKYNTSGVQECLLV